MPVRIPVTVGRRTPLPQDYTVKRVKSDAEQLSMKGSDGKAPDVRVTTDTSGKITVGEYQHGSNYLLNADKFYIDKNSVVHQISGSIPTSKTTEIHVGSGSVAAYSGKTVDLPDSKKVTIQNHRRRAHANIAGPIQNHLSVAANDGHGHKVTVSNTLGRSAYSTTVHHGSTLSRIWHRVTSLFSF